MSLFSLPSPASVRKASKMLPQQAGLTSEKLDETIASHINAAGDFITGRILTAVGKYAWPFTEAQIELAAPSLDGVEEIARQQRVATSATALEAGARLWEEAGALNDEYDEEADRCRTLANRELQSLIDSITGIVNELPALTPTGPIRRKTNRSRIIRLKPRL